MGFWGAILIHVISHVYPTRQARYSHIRSVLPQLSRAILFSAFNIPFLHSFQAVNQITDIWYLHLLPTCQNIPRWFVFSICICYGCFVDFGTSPPHNTPVSSSPPSISFNQPRLTFSQDSLPTTQIPHSFIIFFR